MGKEILNEQIMYISIMYRNLKEYYDLTFSNKLFEPIFIYLYNI